MTTIEIPATIMAQVAYFQASERGPLAFEIEGSDDNPLVKDFSEGNWETEFKSGAKNGEWVGDHVRVVGWFPLPTGKAIVRYTIRWWPVDGGEPDIFVQFFPPDTSADELGST